MKKYLKISFVVILIILIKFVFSFSINSIIIYDYNKNIYDEKLVKLLYILNISEPYIAYYNEGNIFYKIKKYDNAIEKYKEALEKHPPKSRVCDIRINLSLSIIGDKNETINNDKLEEARQNLYKDDCAHEEDDNGKSKEAEELEKEIKEAQKNSSNDVNNDPSNQEEKEDNKDNKDIENELKEREKKSKSNRNSDLNEYENMGDYEYYDGKTW